MKCIMGNLVTQYQLVEKVKWRITEVLPTCDAILLFLLDLLAISAPSPGVIQKQTDLGKKFANFPKIWR